MPTGESHVHGVSLIDDWATGESHVLGLFVEGGRQKGVDGEMNTEGVYRGGVYRG